MVDAPAPAPPVRVASGRDQPLILILSASAGYGHMMAARALRDAFARQRPHARVEVVDVLQWANPFFRRLYAGGYLALCNHAPTAMGWLYDAMDRPEPWFRDWFRPAFQNLNARRAIRRLTRLQPTLIVNTHYLPAEITARLIRLGRVQCPQVTVTTDFETHRLWVQEPTTRYYTATEAGARYLIAWGAPPGRVVISGIPVRPAFAQLETRPAMRTRLGLDEHRPVVLMSCGGFGVGPTQDLFRQLLRTPPEVQIVAIAGRNERLRRRLEAIAAAHQRPVTILGFTETIHEWMRAADLLVTKPGGLTVSEALVCGLPLVIVNPIPGQEARNSDYLLERGAAIKVNSAQLLEYRVTTLLRDPARLDALRRQAAALGRPAAAEIIATDALAHAVPAFV